MARNVPVPVVIYMFLEPYVDTFKASSNVNKELSPFIFDHFDHLGHYVVITSSTCHIRVRLTRYGPRPNLFARVSVTTSIHLST